MYKEAEQSDKEPSLFFHPYNILLSLVLLGVCALFLAFSGAYIYTRLQGNIPPIKIPNLFILNTLVLIGSSVTVNRAKQCYENDDTEGYQKALLLTIVLTLVFMVSQVFAWASLFEQNIYLSHSNTASYVYLISGLHFMHVIAGLPFLILFWHTARKRMKEPVSVLVYFSDPEKRLKLRLLTIYWHFLDGLWVYLVVFFWVNYLVK